MVYLKGGAMRRGEKRFEDLLLKCLFPSGVPADHRIKRTPESEQALAAIHDAGKQIAAEHGIELREDIDEEV